MLINFRESRKWGWSVGGKTEREGERERDVRENHLLLTSHTCHDQGLNLQLRHVS